MKTGLLTYLKYNDFNSIQNGLSVNYFGNNKTTYSFPLRNITADGSGINLVFNNTTDVSITHYIVNTENTTLLKRIGFSISSGKLDLSTSYGSIVESITVSTSSFEQYSIDLQQNPLNNLVIYTTCSTLPTKGVLAVYMYVPETKIDSSKYASVSKIVDYYLYIPNGSNVSVVSASTNEIIKSIPLDTYYYNDNPADAYQAIPSIDGKYVYITTYNSDATNLAIIDTATFTVDYLYMDAYEPYTGAITPDGKYVVIGNYGSNSASLIDTSNNSIVAREGYINEPSYTAVSTDAQYAYFGSGANGTIGIISIPNFTSGVASSFSIDGTPYFLLTNGNYIYTASGNGDLLYVFDYITNKLVAALNLGNYLNDATIASGNIYVAVYGSNVVKAVSLSSNTVIAEISVGSEPYTLASNPDGSIVVCYNSGANSLSIISTSSNKVIGTLTSDNFSGVEDIVCLAEQAYIVNVANSKSTLTVINLQTPSIVKEISLSGEAYYIGVTPLVTVPVLQPTPSIPTQAMFVSGEDGSVYAINGYNGSVIKEISGTPNDIQYMAYSTSAETVYMQGEYNAYIYAVDPNTLTLSTSIPLGTYTELYQWQSFAISPDGKYLYYPYYDSSTTNLYLKKLECSTNTVLSTSSTGFLYYPSMLKVSPDGSKIMYGEYENATSFTVFDTSDLSAINTYTGISSPVYSYTYSPDSEYIYFVTSNNNLYKYTISTNTATKIYSLGQTLTMSGAMPINPNTGYLYVPAGDYVFIFDTSTDDFVTSLDVGNTVEYISFSTDYSKLFAPTLGTQLGIIDTSTDNLTVVSTGQSYTYNVALGNNEDNIFAINGDGSNVVVVNIANSIEYYSFNIPVSNYYCTWIMNPKTTFYQ